ncbi:Uncharacterized protein, contains SIS (Sugar ISomerase) phosphosugar binding domain [Halobacillus karajensis]|uniref:SIS domain-containing protein n=1 Tax=Halobacillus karajensis TaxID=195088 RepID=A0A024P8Y2_9BACI|nr:SIS domain-containing protein [Halobacillus karajensis]CDQ21059.1 putative protein containing SIS (Sugar ISomerase) phosphosugar binding domain protein [Halobacillus karajensis]CDQ24877.1 putative protein containing SIS (Sugar ISomerase) phosphosugar binding domain protein [Halobacillus karajensis]CDQ28763.1 putative protein containing SIS (Sugar ISomerase) phosphosugar binding domain protein [Halobacillus karajensis]SEH96796.1 Uncharacterized protein, contains SIS (Sugar ISomerase) phosphos
MGYLSKVSKQLKEMESAQHEQFERISERFVRCLQQGGIIHTFGCGHSSLLAQDAYYRAGGLVPVRPIIIEPLMLHKGAQKSSENERTSGFVHKYLEKEDLQEKDALLVISTSGRNPAPIETAVYGKQKGLYTSALTSLVYGTSQPSRHESNKRIEDVVEDVIDMNVPVGDVIMNSKYHSYSPVSSVLGAGVLHALLTRTIEKMEEYEVEVPIFRSGNVDGSDHHNHRMMETYHRIDF